MNFDTEIAHTIQQYRIAKLNWECTIEEILSEPHYVRVWEYWQALASSKERNYYQRLEDAPDGLNRIWIMGETAVNYEWRNGEYIVLQEMTKRETKSIYGEE